MFKAIYRAVVPKRVRESLWLLRNPLVADVKGSIDFIQSSDAITDVVAGITLDRFKRQYGVYTSPEGGKLKSSVCRLQDLLDHNVWVTRLNEKVHNRKLWEFVYIAQGLYERGMLEKGKKGLGFAVGKEPLPSLFAKYDCEITATDIDLDTDAGKLWAAGNQHSRTLDDLHFDAICDKDIFHKNVKYKNVNMNSIPGDLTGFDFCWSACAFEHLGSIQKGKEFIYNMINCLKPGGVAIHTTELNLSSYYGANDNTGAVLFGKADFEEMCDELNAQGCTVETFDFRLGDYDKENYVYNNAYPDKLKPHFKIFINGFVATSFGIIIYKQRGASDS